MTVREKIDACFTISALIKVLVLGQSCDVINTMGHDAEGAMIVNWTAETTERGGLQRLWRSCIKGWNRTTNPDRSSITSTSAKVASDHKLRGQMHVSLQGDNWFPVSDLKVTGTR